MIYENMLTILIYCIQDYLEYFHKNNNRIQEPPLAMFKPVFV